jgi:hypothetical protein
VIFIPTLGLKGVDSTCFIATTNALAQTASAWSESFDTLLDAYQQIAEHIPLLQQYSTLFEINQHMKHVLAMMYEDALQFHNRALRVFSKSSTRPFFYIRAHVRLTSLAWRQLFRATWKDFNATFGHILLDVVRHKGLIESQATLIHFQEARLNRAKASEYFQKQEREERQRQHLAVLDWISSTDASLDQQNAFETR